MQMAPEPLFDLGPPQPKWVQLIRAGHPSSAEQGTSHVHWSDIPPAKPPACCMHSAPPAQSESERQAGPL